jgi:hypothetical protein
MIVEKQIEYRLPGETEVLGENLPQHHFCPSQNPTRPDPGLNTGRCGVKPVTDRLSYGAACIVAYFPLFYSLAADRGTKEGDPVPVASCYNSTQALDFHGNNSDMLLITNYLRGKYFIINIGQLLL